MKTQIIFLTILAVFLLVGIVSASPSECNTVAGMLLNCGFEEESPVGELNNWDIYDYIWGSPNSTIGFNNTADNPHSGKYGYKIDTVAVDDGNSSVARGSISQPISSDFKNISFWFRVDAADGGSDKIVALFLYAIDEDDQPVAVSASETYIVGEYSTAWRHVTLNKEDIELPEGYTWDSDTRIELTAYNAADYSESEEFSVVFDDVVVFPTDNSCVVTTTNIFPNGGFEYNDDNWIVDANYDLGSTGGADYNQGSKKTGSSGMQMWGDNIEGGSVDIYIHHELPTTFSEVGFYYKVDLLEGEENWILSSGLEFPESGYNAFVGSVGNINLVPGQWTKMSATRAAITADADMDDPGDYGTTANMTIELYSTNDTNSTIAVSIDDVYASSESCVPAPTGYQSTFSLEIIALCFIFLLSSIWSEENVRFGYVLIPLVTAFFWWGGFLPFAYLTTIIPLIVFMGIFSFLRMQLKMKFGFGGTSGGILYKIVFFLIMIQMVIGYVNGMQLFTEPAILTPDNQYTTYNLEAANQTFGGSSFGIDAIDMVTNGLQMTWTAFKVLWSMLASVFFIYPILVNQFKIPIELSIVIQCGIYMVYSLELFNMIFKPFKAAEV